MGCRVVFLLQTIVTAVLLRSVYSIAYNSHTKKECPEGFHRAIGTEYCFRIFIQKKNWADAVKSCREAFGLPIAHLAVIESEADRKIIGDHIELSIGYWREPGVNLCHENGDFRYGRAAEERTTTAEDDLSGDRSTTLRKQCTTKDGNRVNRTAEKAKKKTCLSLWPLTGDRYIASHCEKLYCSLCQLKKDPRIKHNSW